MTEEAPGAARPGPAAVAAASEPGSTAATAGGNRWLALAVLCAVMLMVILDGNIVTVALPSIQRSLGFSPAGLQWVISAYLIPFGGLLLLSGRLGDLLGARRVFLTGLIAFSVASLACGLAGTRPELIAARLVQGAGAAAASAVSLGMIVRLFPDTRERGTALGAYTFVSAGGGSVGVVLGGVLTQALSWHWIFFVNVPVGVAAIAAGVLVLRAEPGAGLRAGADAAGAVAVTAGLMLLVYAIAGSTQYGWGSARTLAAGGAAIVLLVAFVIRQATARTPLLPLRVFGSRQVSAANAVQVLVVAGAVGSLVLVPQYLQHVLGYGPARTGFAILPSAVAVAVLSVGASARLSARLGPPAVLAGGLAAVAAGLALLIRLPVSGSYVLDLMPSMLLLGGLGLVFPAVIGLAMSAAADPSVAGVTSGLVNTTQQAGAALGVAVLSTLAAARASAAAASGAAALQALTSGYHLAFTVATALLLAALVLTAATLRRAGRAR